VKYSYTTAPGQISVTWEVEEAAWTIPVVFDNLIGPTDAELTAALRERVPSFDGTAPVNVGAGDFIAAALQAVLEAKRIPGRVTYMAGADMRGGKGASESLRYVFIVKDPAPKVCAFHASGASAIPEQDLLAPLAGAIGGDYSRLFVTSASAGTLLDMYRAKGLWRAAFAPPTPKSGECDGVAVTLNVSEGAPYTWDRAEWTGNAVLTGDVLTRTLGMKAGAIADASKIEAGVRDIRKAYRRVGYLQQEAGYTPRLDDQTHRAVFAFAIDEGPQYHMGTLTFPNLREADAATLGKRWKLKPGDVYDETYEGEYVSTELAQLRTANGLRAQLEREIDPATHVVNLRVVFK
jgi:hypothetical protein